LQTTVCDIWYPISVETLRQIILESTGNDSAASVKILNTFASISLLAFEEQCESVAHSSSSKLKEKAE